MSKCSPFDSATGRKVRSTYSSRSWKATAPDVDGDRAGLDLGEVEDVVDQLQEIVARRLDGQGVLHLTRVQTAFRIAQPAARRESAGCSAASAARATCWPGTRTCTSTSGRAAAPSPRAPGVPARPPRSSARPRHSARRGGRPSPRAQALRPLQLLLAALQLRRQRLRLLQQLLRPAVGLDGVEHDPDALDELIEELVVRRAEALEGGQLDHGLHLALEENGQHDDVERRRLAEAGR